MTRSTLWCWSSFPKEKLLRHIAVEETRMRSGAPWLLEDQQLLDAARERLLNWREPHPRRRREATRMTKQTDTEPTLSPKPTTEPEPAEEAAKNSEKPQKRKRSARPQASAPIRKEPKMAKKTKSRGKPAAAKEKKTRNGRIGPDDKIMKGSQPNPFKEGSGPYERTALILKSIGTGS